MPAADALQALRELARIELTERLLPYWMAVANDRSHGGVIGSIAEDGTANHAAPKGAILHARVLWTFSAAARALGDDAVRRAADRVAAYFTTRFIDRELLGVYWSIDPEGRPLDARKHVYAQAFAIYGLAEHFTATGNADSLDAARSIFRHLEARAWDADRVGYEECFARDWTPLDDVRLGDTDLNERRSMNTHLHLLEAYTTLYEAWPDARVEQQLRTLVALFLDRIIAPAGDHVVGFFTERWEPRSTAVSFGHDIETSWLLVEAANVLGDSAVTQRARAAATRLAASVLEHGFDAEHGGIFHGRSGDELDTDKEWWPQAEAIVGFLAAYQESGDTRYVDVALATWRFIERRLIDRQHGEWYRRVSRAGDRSRGGEKVGPWKCPYHNGRACLEIIERVDALLTRGGQVA